MRPVDYTRPKRLGSGMTQVEYTALLGGDAASFKGNRTYVHATDLVPALDGMSSALPGGAVLQQVEFHAPLTTRGVVHVASDLSLPPKSNVNATGIFSDPDGTEHPFVVFASPLPILSADRRFDEEGLWPSCTVDTDANRVSAGRHAGLSLPEQLSSMMKLLCKTLLPQHDRWWFVRLTKSAPLPDQATTLTLTLRKIIAGRLVSADITTETGPIGTIDFVGKSA